MLGPSYSHYTSPAASLVHTQERCPGLGALLPLSLISLPSMPAPGCQSRPFIPHCKFHEGSYRSHPEWLTSTSAMMKHFVSQNSR